MEYKGYTIEIKQDIDPQNPRDWDNLGTMVCFHKHYKLGDSNHDFKNTDFNSWEELKQAIIKNEKPSVILPIYMYDHSGITINTTGFSCPWDSGQIGFIFISKQKAYKEYGKKRISPQFKKRLTNYLVNEVKTYDQYLTGEVYGYIITKDNEESESCWGFFGYDIAENEAKGIVDYYIKNAA
jgi:hypothetical protein